MVTKLRKSIPREIEDELLGRANVVGVGRGPKRIDGKSQGEETIVVFVSQKLHKEDLDEDDIVPETVSIQEQEIETDVQESPGGFFAQHRQRQMQTSAAGQSAQSTRSPRAEAGLSKQMMRAQDAAIQFGETRKDRWRPSVPAGVSIGNENSNSAGTNGTPPLRTENGDVVFLTNAHVAAPFGNSAPDDAILQPGVFDGGVAPDDTIGRLLEAVELSEEEDNTTDSALVEITGNVENDILGVGKLQGWKTATYDVDHYKSGRTTATTSSRLVARDVTARVNYGAEFSEPLTFVGLDVFEAFSAAGDSGSLIGVEESDGFHGTDLLFAGSTAYTLGIPMDAVQDEHGILEPIEAEDDENGVGSAGEEQGQPQLPGANPEGPPELEQSASSSVSAELEAEAQATYTALTGYVAGNSTVYRWHGAWNPGYTVHYSVRPTTNGQFIRGSVYYTYKDGDGNLWYLVQIQNLTSSASYYDVRASYEYS
ncbi:hypothetical protein [Halogeometricum luteum]|uniref:S1 family peptidase n=1 Tax=Halogeometricum luteum TaxID=2950537 RepID=A0ABU2G1W9_9EURY|nr:hypothetical protein [Halogeometricum sp. S3BR5-2]MDS0294781.1 S1 family peptidase [Halogeometricum sp. S3BR5-2]